MVKVGDVFQLVLKHEYLEQSVVNVYHYEVIASDLANFSFAELENHMLQRYAEQVLVTLSEELELVESVWDNLTTNDEFHQESASLFGEVVDQPMPSYVCYGIKLNRQSKVTRSGSKRICGVVEGAVVGNFHILPQPSVDLLELYFGGFQIYPDIDGQGSAVQLLPVIVGRTLNMSGKYVLDLSKINRVLTATVINAVTTQNSRKI